MDGSSINLVEERKTLLTRVSEEEGFVLEVRTDMSSPKERGKLRRYKLTGDKEFNSMGKETFEGLRRDFFQVLSAAKILTDLLFNYHDSGGEGLTYRHGFGPYDFGKLKKDKFPSNPYGLSLTDCEREANTILNNMVFPGPVAEMLDKIEMRNEPTLSVIGFYDQLFFPKDAVSTSDRRTEYLNIKFNDFEHPAVTFGRMQTAKGVWEQSKGSFTDPHEDIQQMLDAVENGNMAKHNRSLVKDARRDWQTDGKGFDDAEQHKRFKPTDIPAFLHKFLQDYERAVKDGIVPAAVRKAPKLGAHSHEATASYEALAEHLGVTPQAFISMINSRSGDVENDNPSADPRLMKETQEYRTKTPDRVYKKPDAKKSVTFDQDKSGERPKPLSFTDDDKCRELDAIRAKK